MATPMEARSSQDLGYYPFGSVEFSNLVHYVRSGDFVRELLLQSKDANEYAFALGALAHYASDISGHPAVNQAVSIHYPKLRAKYGNSVRYAQEHRASQDGVRFRHGAGGKESLGIPAVSRLHRFPGVQAAAGADFSYCLWSGVERCPGAGGSRNWLLPLFCQPYDSANDPDCIADTQKRHDEGDARSGESEISLPPLALRL
jgi:hypothetical protein